MPRILTTSLRSQPSSAISATVLGRVRIRKSTRSTGEECRWHFCAHGNPLCPFCVQRHLTRFNFPSFFNVLEEPFMRASLLLSYCRSCVLFHRAADLVTELLISRLKVRF